jgi:hypothetical protein
VRLSLLHFDPAHHSHTPSHLPDKELSQHTIRSIPSANLINRTSIYLNNTRPSLIF